ncbi:hypothetical protein N7516_005832 [Penicillium verrucosum]|uniref:uncharacterized protein n=1 Tax=Penicillium verrucosum TaxID=60171 RepID=UPI00254587E0|nr:uncharacterized protein N7516_005832 [Penicillium verrucosum]KAJ5931343.1 hypothetical protein N7516_005832 [Penicillium verrucosum]
MGYGGLELVSDLQRWPKGYDGLEVRVEQGKEVPITRGGLCPVSVPEMPWPSIPDDGLVKADGPKDAKRICGMRPIVFWPLLVVAILIVVIAAVGGGIGGSYLANRGKSSDPTTSESTTDSSMPVTSSISDAETSTATTASKTSSAAVTSGTSGIASNPCPAQNLTTITGSDESIFTLLCAVDWPSGIKTAYGNGRVGDLTRFTEYTLKSCVSQCVKWNTENGEKCKGVTYSANLTASYDGGQEGNCFLKNSVGSYFPNSGTSMAAGILGG